MSQYIFDNKVNIWLRNGFSGISYSDGEIEDKLHRHLIDAKDKSIASEEISSFIEDWASEYHLSKKRHCLLRPFSFNSEDSILELGSGCGAMTRYLGETGAQVVAVEGSKKRAVIAAERCHDLKNVTVYCDNIESFQTDRKFDVVTLIGVLEYSPLFIKGSMPVKQCLEIAKSFLTQNGVLIIAIENQLGLKYFAGCEEDHLGKAYYGIEGLYNRATPVTFVKKELKKLIESVGYQSIDFLYPFPDYKMPTLILNEKAFLNQTLVSNLLFNRAERDYSGTNDRAFSTQLAWDVVIQDDLVGELANSFLVIAGVDHTQRIKSDWLASHYSVERARAYCTETMFKRVDEKILISKNHLWKYADNNSECKIIQQIKEVCELVDGDLYAKKINRLLQIKVNVTHFAELLKPWLNFLKSNAKNKLEIDNPLEYKLPSHFIDAVPFNFIISDLTGDLVYIDHEWKSTELVPFSWVFIRGLAYLMTQLDIEGIWDGKSIKKIVEKVAKKLELQIDEAIFDKVVVLEDTFQKEVSGIQFNNWSFFDLLNANLPEARKFTYIIKKQRKLLRDKESLLAERDAQLAYQSGLKEMLEIERFSVIKPIFRRFYRAGISLVSRMPPRMQFFMRRIKHRLLPRSISLQLPEWKGAQPLLTGNEYNQIPLNCDSNGYDVIVFPVIDWNFRIQRPQHLAKGLAAKGHRVFYLSPTFGVGEPDIKVVERVDERIFVCQIQIPEPHPAIYEELPSEIQNEQFIEIVNITMKELAGDFRSPVALVDHPFWYSMAKSIKGITIVYDCMDDHSGFVNNSKEILQVEKDLLKNADLVITTSARLSEKIREVRENSIIRNAAESLWFSQAPEHLIYKSNRPVVGYYGAISDWFDIDLIIKSAKAYPEFDFVLVGSTFLCNTNKAKKVKNIHFIGEVPYADLKGYLYAFDVCIIPFKLIELIQCTNPVKFYEYIAAGKPVVSTDIPEVRLVSDYAYVSSDHDEFIKNLELAMASKEDESAIKARQSFALENQWEHRVDQLEKSISELVPLVSVVVLTYNNLEFTKSCLHSLEQYTFYLNWELIIVDNASTDGTPDYLVQYAKGHDNIRVILNDNNLGFSAGNNVGLRAAKGEYLILLNNDTFVTPNWIKKLIVHFQQDKSLGLIGPVTNNIGNEAKIELNYVDMEDMIDKSNAYIEKHLNIRLYVNTVAFFCVAIRREVIDEVGLLDEDFGRGFFEDDDYCIRARNAGFKVAIAEDVFVHHHLSASFDKLKDQEKQKLFEKNKAIYENKWGTWVPHQYR